MNDTTITTADDTFEGTAYGCLPPRIYLDLEGTITSPATAADWGDSLPIDMQNNELDIPDRFAPAAVRALNDLAQQLYADIVVLSKSGGTDLVNRAIGETGLNADRLFPVMDSMFDEEAILIDVRDSSGGPVVWFGGTAETGPALARRLHRENGDLAPLIQVIPDPEVGLTPSHIQEVLDLLRV